MATFPHVSHVIFDIRHHYAIKGFNIMISFDLLGKEQYGTSSAANEG
jgi:hypothetical protein